MRRGEAEDLRSFSNRMLDSSSIGNPTIDLLEFPDFCRCFHDAIDLTFHCGEVRGGLGQLFPRGPYSCCHSEQGRFGIAKVCVYSRDFCADSCYEDINGVGFLVHQAAITLQSLNVRGD